MVVRLKVVAGVQIVPVVVVGLGLLTAAAVDIVTALDAPL
jgi:hypothetical protein